MRLPWRVVFFGLVAWFLISAVLGALISYNTALAWSRFAMIASGVVVSVGFARMPETVGHKAFPLLAGILAFLPTALILYFGLTNDWTVRLGKVAWLDPLLRWFATWQPQFPGWRLDSNALGGVLAMLVPLQAVALWNAFQKRMLPLALLLVSFFGLLVSVSRGAWIAFGLIAWIAAMWLMLTRVMPAGQRGRTRILIGIALVAYLALTIGSAMAFTPLGAWLLSEGGGHWRVARHSFDLVSDYPFTGIGLGAFTMAYSSYVLLVHVPHTIHAHNLFLDLWLEQGLLGLLVFVGLIAVGVMNATRSRWHVAALASVGVLVLHGLLDDPFYGYGGGAIPFLLIPLGVLARESSARSIRAPRWLVPALAGALAIIGLLILSVPAIQAMWEANLGALAQTRAELSVYEWPRYSFQDQLRRDRLVNLDAAMAHYERALRLDPGNATANRRLGQIALARGEYDQARQYFEYAYARAPQQSATRLMLGEVLAMAQDLEAAAKLWRTVDLSAGQLDVRRWWYEYIGDPERLDLVDQAARLQ